MKIEKRIKATGTLLAVAFASITFILLITQAQTDRLLLAAVTIFLVCVPWLFERFFHSRLSLPLYIFALFYAIGPMLGHCWYFYYTICWWDKLLHMCGGVMFAIFGAYLFERLSKSKENHMATAVFALCFSMAVAVAWEFFEFGADVFFGMDMQDDIVITSLTSYLLGDAIGVTGTIADIHSVTVNGIVLPGYIDIGLVDSMLDMLLESLGALVTSLLLLADKGRHPLIQDRRCSTF